MLRTLGAAVGWLKSDSMTALWKAAMLATPPLHRWRPFSAAIEFFATDEHGSAVFRLQDALRTEEAVADALGGAVPLNCGR